MTNYTKLDLHQKEQVVERVQRSEDRASICKSMRIILSSLVRLVRLARDGKSLAAQTPGPGTTLTPEYDENIVTWIFAMQRNSYPVERADVLLRVREICNELRIPPLSDGWYSGFRQRHPELVDRESQVVCRKRHEVDRDALYTLFSTMAKIVIEHGIDATRIYNMDETAFASRRKTTKVLAARGSTNVHTKTLTTNFHMSVVACANAAGSIVPPLFILPGKRIDAPTASACTIDDECITTSATGFMNGDIFVLWLDMFAASVPPAVKRPLVLVCDGYLSHLTHEDIMDTLEEHQILLVCLPANATHLVQPLDVAVFAPYKKLLRTSIKQYMLESGVCTISKADAVRLASSAWTAGMKGTNAVSGFKACCIYPPSFAAMEERLARFGKGGTKTDDRDHTWLKHKQCVRDGVLTLPPLVEEGAHKRKTVDVAGRLLTRDMVAAELQSKRARK